MNQQALLDVSDLANQDCVDKGHGIALIAIPNLSASVARAELVQTRTEQGASYCQHMKVDCITKAQEALYYRCDGVRMLDHSLVASTTWTTVYPTQSEPRCHVNISLSTL
jgi:hypothetical protein